MKSIEFLESKASKTPSKLGERIEWRRKNRGWLKKSQKIALAIMDELENQKMTQKELAARLEVSPQYVNKVLRGTENLSIETIDKIERALGMELISIPDAHSKQKFNVVKKWEAVPANIAKGRIVVMQMSSYGKAVNFANTLTA